MALVSMRGKNEYSPPAGGAMAALLKDFSIEVMPRTAAKIDDFTALLPTGTRVYVAHIDGTPIEDMVACARRIRDQGFQVMPHFPARLIRDRAMLSEWISRYANEAGINQALLLAGGISHPHGEYADSMALLETGLFDAAGFTHLHVAGHPEGNKDIDADGGRRNLDAALRRKQDYAAHSDAKMAIVTQFCFESAPVIEWANSLKAAGIEMPIHIGVAGPAKLQTMIKFSIACGVGPSLRVLQRRARDVRKLLLPFEPGQFLSELADYRAKHPDFNITNVHFFPLGGIKTGAKWAIDHGGANPARNALQS